MSVVKKEIREFQLNPDPQDDAQLLIQTAGGVTQKVLKSGLLNNVNSALLGIQSQIETLEGTDVIGGNLLLASGESVYTVYDSRITENSNPVCTLISSIVADDEYYIPSMVVKNVVNGSFDVQLSDILPEAGFKLSWLCIPTVSLYRQISIDTGVHVWNPEYMNNDDILYAFLNSTDNIDEGALVTINNVQRSGSFVDNTHVITQITQGKIRKSQYFNIDDATLSDAEIIDDGTYRHVILESDLEYIEWDTDDVTLGMDKLQLYISSEAVQGDVDVYAYNGVSEEQIGTYDLSTISAIRPSVVVEFDLDRPLYLNEKLRLKRRNNNVRLHQAVLVHPNFPPRAGEKRTILFKEGINNMFGGNLDLNGSIYLEHTDSALGGGSSLVSELDMGQLGQNTVKIGGYFNQEFDANTGGWIANTSTLSPSKGYIINGSSVSWTISHDLSDDGFAILGDEEVVYTLSSDAIKWNLSLEVVGGVDTADSFVSMLPLVNSFDEVSYDFGDFDYDGIVGIQSITEPNSLVLNQLRYDWELKDQIDSAVVAANTDGMNKHFLKLILPTTTISALTYNVENIISIGSTKSST